MHFIVNQYFDIQIWQVGLERPEEEDPQKRPFRGPNNWPSELPELKEVRGPGGRDMYIDALDIYIYIWYLYIYIYNLYIYPMDPSAFLGCIGGIIYYTLEG